MKKVLLVLGMVAFTFSMKAQWSTQIKESKNDFGDVTLHAYQKLYIEGTYKETPIGSGEITRDDDIIVFRVYTKDKRDIDFDMQYFGNIRIRDSKGNVTILDVDVIQNYSKGLTVYINDEDKIKAFDEAVFNCDDYKIVIGEGSESVLIEFTINETNNIN